MGRRQLLLSSLGIASVLGRLIRAQDLDPLRIMPNTHKLLLENRFVRVIESKVPAGAKEARHSHPYCVTVYLADVDVEIRTFPDGKTTRVHRTAGTCRMERSNGS